MFNIAICDDDCVICRQFESVLNKHTYDEEVEATSFYTGESLMIAFEEGKRFDFIFLGIEFESINGVEVGRLIRDKFKDENVQIVYISAKSEYAMELFEIRPMNFLIKPIDNDVLIENVEKAMHLKGLYNKCFEAKTGKNIQNIQYGSIIYFESRNRKVIVKTARGEIAMYGKIADIVKKCPDNFVRIHQSYLINDMHISVYKPGSVIMDNGDKLSISKKYKREVDERMFGNGGKL